MAFKELFEKQGVEPYAVIITQWPASAGPKSAFFATRALSDSSLGPVHGDVLGRVLSISPFKRSLPKPGGTLQRIQLSVVLDNADLLISKLVGPHNERNPMNRIISVKIGTLTGLGISPDTKFIQFGRVDSFSMRDGKYTFTTNGSLGLTSRPKIERIGDTHSSGVAFWPNAFPGHFSRLFPVVFGKINSTGLSLVNPAQGGPWPLTFVNNVAGNFVFIATVGRTGTPGAASTVQALYKNGQPLDIGVGGRTKFDNVVIDGLVGNGVGGFLASGFILTDTADFTDANGNLSLMSCDVTGPAGTENPITALAEILEHFIIENFNGLGASFPLMEIVANEREWSLSGGIINNITSEALLGDLLNTFNIRIFKPAFVSTPEVSILQPEFDPIPTDKIIDDLGHLLSPPVIDFATAEMLTKVTFLFGRHEALNEFSFSGSVEDPDIVSRYDHNKLGEIKMAWTRDQTTAKDVAVRRLEINKNAQIRVTAELGLRGILFDLSDRVALTLRELPDTSLNAGSGDRPFEVQAASLDLLQGKTSFVFEDIEVLVLGGFFLGDDTIQAPNWIAASANDRKFGYVCDEATGEFSNGDAGKRAI